VNSDNFSSGNDILRIGLAGVTRSRAAAFDRWVFSVATARASEPGVEAQAQACLMALEQNLRAAGSDKSRLLFVLVLLADIAAKPQFNRAWDAWIDRAAPPVRACVGAGLESGDLVEIVAVAARCDEGGRACGPGNL
jgi:enamine deaminase RidA (YjgF/YER057c/UK114 family)